MEFKNILYEVKDGILYLTLNRPEVRNALSPEMWKDIQTAVEAASLSAEPGTRLLQAVRISRRFMTDRL